MSGIRERRAQRIREYAQRGMTRAQIADEMLMSYAGVVRYGLDFGIKFVRQGLGAENVARAETMSDMYRTGQTLEQIGSVFGLSRERVRQIITKHSGLRASDGGQTFRSSLTAQKREAERDARYRAKFGCSFAEWSDIRKHPGRPTYAFAQQRYNAHRRGIGWRLSLTEWWAIWQASGRWGQRGRGRGYMMCRFGDAGAYEAGNVYITTGVHNGSYQPNNPYRKSHPQFAETMAAMRQRSDRQTTPTPERIAS